MKEDPSFGLADDGEEKDKRKDKKDKEKKRDKKDGKENKEKKRRVHLGTDQVATEGSFGTKIKSRQHISSEENEGSNDEVIVEVGILLTICVPKQCIALVLMLAVHRPGAAEARPQQVVLFAHHRERQKRPVPDPQHRV